MTTRLFGIATLLTALAMASPLVGSLAQTDATRRDQAAQADTKRLPDEAAQTARKDVPKYVPPKRGAPNRARLVGGASRGEAAGAPAIAVLAPDHTGLTTLAQPTLYWYVSNPGARRIDVTIQDETTPLPLLEVTPKIDASVGLVRLRLADHAVSLVAGVEYRWSVALVANADQRSGDIVSSGYIMRVDAPPALKEALRGGGPERIPFVLADHGIWYDALSTVSDLIAASPHDQPLREQRAALLEQIGLPQAARAGLAQGR